MKIVSTGNSLGRDYRAPHDCRWCASARIVRDHERESNRSGPDSENTVGNSAFSSLNPSILRSRLQFCGKGHRLTRARLLASLSRGTSCRGSDAFDTEFLYIVPHWVHADWQTNWTILTRNTTFGVQREWNFFLLIFTELELRNKNIYVWNPTSQPFSRYRACKKWQLCPKFIVNEGLIRRSLFSVHY